MKKLLLGSVAVLGLAAFAAPAMAQSNGVDLELGGHFKGYVAGVDQDTAINSDERNIDWLQETELHFTGETTLDNGLTVGFHAEANVDNDDDTDIEESYAYFSGHWGRVNAGAEDGAAYLLQVAAPSADGNFDGLRQVIQPVNYGVSNNATVRTVAGGTIAAATNLNTNGADGGGNDVVVANAVNLSNLLVFDYDHDVTGNVNERANKLTYLTPVFSGFQLGASFAPEASTDTRDLDGVNPDDEAGDFGNTYEISARYEGQIEALGFAVGAGYSHSELESAQVVTFIDNGANGGTANDNVFQAGETVVGSRDDRQTWNAGIDFNYGPFGLGFSYLEDDLGYNDGADQETFVVGADYTTGPFKLGATYYNQDLELDAFLGNGAGELETDRYTGGVVYTYGPGMTFRGSVNYIEHEVPSSSDIEATSVLLGTQINF